MLKLMVKNEEGDIIQFQSISPQITYWLQKKKAVTRQKVVKAS